MRPTVVHFASNLVCDKAVFSVHAFFTAVLPWAMRSWRAFVSQVGFDLGDGLP